MALGLRRLVPKVFMLFVSVRAAVAAAEPLSRVQPANAQAAEEGEPVRAWTNILTRTTSLRRYPSRFQQQVVQEGWGRVQLMVATEVAVGILLLAYLFSLAEVEVARVLYRVRRVELAESEAVGEALREVVLWELEPVLYRAEPPGMQLSRALLVVRVEREVTQMADLRNMAGAEAVARATRTGEPIPASEEVQCMRAVVEAAARVSLLAEFFARELPVESVGHT
jgi:hypothetical protein